jgi:hypothetical protein
MKKAFFHHRGTEAQIKNRKKGVLVLNTNLNLNSVPLRLCGEKMPFLALFLFLSTLLHAQFAPPPPPLRGMTPVDEELVQTKPADPVLIQGKKADQLSDDETRDFLQGKIRTISQNDGEVELIRVAPGYPMTLSFAEVPQNVVLGDPKMVGYQKMGKTLVLSATTRQGDTSLQVFFSGGKLRVYHLFVESDFTTGETAVRVDPFSAIPQKQLTSSTGGALSLKDVLDVVRNYDLLIREKSIRPQEVRRFDLFRKSRSPGFTYFCLYRFSSGPVVVTFSYQNGSKIALRVDESKIRLELGHQLFIPDFVSFHQNFLMPEESTTGVAILQHPPFAPDQPFELVSR